MTTSILLPCLSVGILRYLPGYVQLQKQGVPQPCEAKPSPAKLRQGCACNRSSKCLYDALGENATAASYFSKLRDSFQSNFDYPHTFTALSLPTCVHSHSSTIENARYPSFLIADASGSPCTKPTSTCGSSSLGKQARNCCQRQEKDSP